MAFLIDKVDNKACQVARGKSLTKLLASAMVSLVQSCCFCKSWSPRMYVDDIPFLGAVILCVITNCQKVRSPQEVVVGLIISFLVTLLHAGFDLTLTCLVFGFCFTILLMILSWVSRCCLGCF